MKTLLLFLMLLPLGAMSQGVSTRSTNGIAKGLTIIGTSTNLAVGFNKIIVTGPQGQEKGAALSEMTFDGTTIALSANVPLLNAVNSFGNTNSFGGNVGFGTDIPGSAIQLDGELPTGLADWKTLFFGKYATNGSGLSQASIIIDSQSAYWGIGQTNSYFTIGTADSPVAGAKITSPKLMIRNDGNVAIGNNPTESKLLVQGKLRVQQTVDGSYTIIHDGAIPGVPAGFVDINNYPVTNGSANCGLEVLGLVPYAQGQGNGIAFAGYFDAGDTNPIGDSAEFFHVTGNKENNVRGDYAGYGAFHTRPMGGAYEERMRITSTGNVGIGTTTPFQKLEVNGNALVGGNFMAGEAVLADGGSSAAFGVDTYAHGQYSFANGDNAHATNSYAVAWGREAVAGGAFSWALGHVPLVLSDNAFLLRVVTNSINLSVQPDFGPGTIGLVSERGVFLGTNLVVLGALGIGTATPTQPLHVFSGTTYQALFSGWNPVTGVGVQSGALLLGNDPAFQGRIHYDGTGVGRLYIENTFDGVTGDIYFRTRTAGTPVNAMIIYGNGNVGIGVTVPASKLDVAGDILTAGNLLFEGTTADGFETTLTVTDPTADRTVTFQNASGTVAYLSDISAGGGTNRYYEAGEAFHWVEVGGTNGDPYGIKGASSSATVSAWSISYGGNLLTDGNITAAGSLNITSGAQLGSTLTVTDTLTANAGVDVNGALTVTGLASANAVASSRSNLLAAATIAVGASPFNWTNAQDCNVHVFVDGVSVTGTTAINGGVVYGTIGQNLLPLGPGEWATITYTLGTPTATWRPSR